MTIELKHSNRNKQKKNTQLISQNKYFKTSLIYSNVAPSKNFFGFEQIEADNLVFDATLIFEEINKELEEYLLEKSIKTDLTASVFDFLEGLSDRVQEEFDQLLKGDTDKK